jgi:hypothetical protein
MTISILSIKVTTITYLWKVVIRNSDHLNFVSYKTQCVIMQGTHTTFGQYLSISRKEVYNLIGTTDCQSS